MRQLDSGALTLLNEILQLGGGGEQTTQLDDGNVSQVLDVQQVVRRSLTFASTGGLGFIGFENVHVGAGAISETFNPYAGPDVGANAFPTDIPRGFDVWLLHATMRRTAGAGALTGGEISYNILANMRAKGDGTAGRMALGLWTSIEALTGNDYGITPGGQSLIKLGLRIRRGITLSYDTNAAGAATFHCQAMIGVFPAGLGQDGVA